MRRLDNVRVFTGFIERVCSGGGYEQHLATGCTKNMMIFQIPNLHDLMSIFICGFYNCCCKGAGFLPDIPTCFEFQPRRLTKRVFHHQTGNYPPTSAETHDIQQLHMLAKADYTQAVTQYPPLGSTRRFTKTNVDLQTSTFSTACTENYYGASVQNDDLPLAWTNHIGQPLNIHLQFLMLSTIKLRYLHMLSITILSYVCCLIDADNVAAKRELAVADLGCGIHTQDDLRTEQHQICEACLEVVGNARHRLTLVFSGSKWTLFYTALCGVCGGSNTIPTIRFAILVLLKLLWKFGLGYKLQRGLLRLQANGMDGTGNQKIAESFLNDHQPSSAVKREPKRPQVLTPLTSKYGFFCLRHGMHMMLIVSHMQHDIAGRHSLIDSQELLMWLLRDMYDDMMFDGVKPERDTFHGLIAGSVKGVRLQDCFFFRDQMMSMSYIPYVHFRLPDYLYLFCF
ncbi:pentatricopeptide repeat (PPR) superfamily protein [Artemisia annua]|uniref:Pentatricopeptide repeat (PPR) superfamily protein n=1 Tax=Artemisia annua TaxID=35608 RepID=A0A2U1Q109_ARTAN|nr:pentatricopeptide repeat (PPR) superfamily protein [Artemisia annua]